MSIQDCLIDHNYRQGISVISAVNLTVRNTNLSYTGVPSKLSGHEPGVDYGTPPMSGVDCEPDGTRCNHSTNYIRSTTIH